ncbi:MAG: HAD family hydrolase [Nitrospinota bacterium]
MAADRNRGVVFDLWNTLAYNTASPNPVVWMARRLGIDGRPDWTGLLERAYMTAPVSGIEEALERLGKTVPLPPLDPAPFVEAFARADRSVRLFDDVLPTLRDLRPRFRLALLTNTQSFGLEFIETTGLADLFDVTCYSYERGWVKPDPRIFRWTAERLGLPARRLTMVGDNLAQDVLAAEAAGWRGILIKRSGGELSHTEAGTHQRTVRGLEEIRPLLDD